MDLLHPAVPLEPRLMSGMRTWTWADRRTLRWTARRMGDKGGEAFTCEMGQRPTSSSSLYYGASGKPRRESASATDGHAFGVGLTLRSGSGRDIAEIFEELPDRKLFSDYYQAIAQPISLAEIEVSAKQAWVERRGSG